MIKLKATQLTIIGIIIWLSLCIFIYTPPARRILVGPYGVLCGFIFLFIILFGIWVMYIGLFKEEDNIK